MGIETQTAHVTRADGNVFADLGFPHDEANALQAASQQVIAEKLAVKMRLTPPIPAGPPGSAEAGGGGRDPGHG